MIYLQAKNPMSKDRLEELEKELREKVKEEVVIFPHSVETFEVDNKSKGCSYLTMSLKLDTTEFENDLKRLGEKLLTISEI